MIASLLAPQAYVLLAYRLDRLCAMRRAGWLPCFELDGAQHIVTTRRYVLVQTADYDWIAYHAPAAWWPISPRMVRHGR